MVSFVSLVFFLTTVSAQDEPEPYPLDLWTWPMETYLFFAPALFPVLF